MTDKPAKTFMPAVDASTVARAKPPRANPPRAKPPRANPPRANPPRAKTSGIYSNVLITQRVPMAIVYVGDNIKQTLEKKIAFDIEGKCIVEGYVKPGSCAVLSYSSGELIGSDVVFVVIVECLVCCPVEGMLISCIVNNITESAGIKAKTDDSPSPVVIYIARDHHFKNIEFSKLKIDDTIIVRVIGQRFELNDEYISIIAELVENKPVGYRKAPRKKLVISSAK